MTAIALVQARTGASRLPGKVMLPLKGEPMAVRICQRAEAIPGVGQVVLCTTTEPADDVVIDMAFKAGVRAFRAPNPDVTAAHLESRLTSSRHTNRAPESF